MIDPVNDFDVRVGARLLDFFDSRRPWNRRLWNVGLALTLQEVLEATAATRAGVLSDDSLGFLLNVAQKMVGTDPGAGSLEQRQTLQAALRTKVRLDGLEYHLISQQESFIRRGYLTRWAATLRGPDHPRVERAARAVASHLLDLGFSSDFLHRWWSYRLRHEAVVRRLADIIDDAQILASAEARDFEVLAPVVTAIRFPEGAAPDEWRPAPDVSHWLRSNRFDVAGVRQDGGFLFSIKALDPGSAAIRTSELMDRLISRMAVGTKRQLPFINSIWVKGEPKPFPLDRTNRGVWVSALERENLVYSVRPSGGIDAAIELLSHLQSSSPSAAVAGGWAAIEALLSEPSDRGGAADRLAMLVACSFPRAELTYLSYVLPTVDPALAAQLAEATENRDRSNIVAAALHTGVANIAALGPSDRAAAARMVELLANPHRVLHVIEDHAAIAFRRLYRQRNLVLHWGKTDAVALRASLRTAAPLVGAGIDRIIHAFYVDHLWPMQIVARARVALATVGSAVGPNCTDLLG